MLAARHDARGSPDLAARGDRRSARAPRAARPATTTTPTCGRARRPGDRPPGHGRRRRPARPGSGQPPGRGGRSRRRAAALAVGGRRSASARGRDHRAPVLRPRERAAADRTEPAHKRSRRRRLVSARGAGSGQAAISNASSAIPVPCPILGSAHDHRTGQCAPKPHPSSSKPMQHLCTAARAERETTPALAPRPRATASNATGHFAPTPHRCCRRVEHQQRHRW